MALIIVMDNAERKFDMYQLCYPWICKNAHGEQRGLPHLMRGDGMDGFVI